MVVRLLLCAPRRQGLELFSLIFWFVLLVSVVRREHLVLIFFAILLSVLLNVVALMHRLGVPVATFSSSVVVPLGHRAIVVHLATKSLTRPWYHKTQLPLGFTDPGKARSQHRFHALWFVDAAAVEQNLCPFVVRKACSSQHLAGKLLVRNDQGAVLGFDLQFRLPEVGKPFINGLARFPPGLFPRTVGIVGPLVLHLFMGPIEDFPHRR